MGAAGLAAARAGSVIVPVVDIRVVRMRVRQRLVSVLMRVRLCAVPSKGVGMVVVLVVPVAMAMNEGLVRVRVGMLLSEV